MLEHATSRTTMFLYVHRYSAREKFVVIGVSPVEWAWVEAVARGRVAKELVEMAVQVTTVRKDREQGGMNGLRRQWIDSRCQEHVRGCTVFTAGDANP